jgi:AbrB family looped-hinge helix DNA binding protein
METTVTERGQTAIPAQIRKRFGLKPHQKLVWIEDGQIISILPMAFDPIAAFRKSGKPTGLVAALLKSRYKRK